MNTKKVVINNLLWKFAERCGAQGVSFVVSIVLARLLVPNDYGVVALVSSITTILYVFVDSGFGSALIQKKETDDLDFSSVFYFNIVCCLMLYGVLFMAAPFVASFYTIPELTALIRVSGLTVIVAGIKNIQQAYVAKSMQFKRFFFATLGGTVGSAIVGIVMAYKGFGPWALVFQGLFNSVVDTTILWFTIKWRPKLRFSFSRLRDLFAYGWKLLLSAFLDTTYNNISSLIIGKKYTPSDLAYYNKGGSWPYLLVNNINVSIDSVLFPVMSTEQGNIEIVKNMTRKAIKTSSYIMWPVMVGLIATSNSLVRLILTEKWLPCVPYLCLMCFTYAFWPIHTANLNAIKAVGRSDIFLALEVIKKIIGLLVLLVSIQFGVLVFATAYALTAPINALLNAYPNRKLLNYSYREQISDMIPSVLTSIVMGIVVYFVSYLNLNDFYTLILQVFVGVLIYIFLSKLFKLESYDFLISSIKSKK